MSPTFQRLLLTTALCLPLGQAAFAQSETACADLGTAINDGLPEAMANDAERLQTVQSAGDPAACDVELVAIRALVVDTEQTDTAETDTATEGAELAETDQLTVTLEDQMTVQGMVYLDRQPANVDIQGGDTEVTVTNDQPDVTVTEGQANIVIRQAAANVVVEMPQPTIRIEQPAPEIIITMPAPGVDVANARPQVEVRQAEPTVTVTQAAPMVDLELQQVPEGQEPSTTVTDRASGNTYAAGETSDATTLEDATVNMAQTDPTVVYQDGAAKTPTINRAEPQVTFESAEPQVQVTSMGEPQIEMVQTGDPVITFQEADNATGDQPAAAMDANAEGTAPADATATDPAMAEGDAAATDAAATDGATDAAATDAAATDGATDAAPEGVEPITEEGADAMEAAPAADGTDAAATDAMAPEGDAATDPAMTDAAATEGDAATDPAMTDTATATAPSVERDGYTAVPMEDLRAEMLQGMRVYGTNDENVGDVATVIVTPEGAVQGLVLNVGGFLGLGERQVQVPADMVTILSDGNADTRVYVDATEDRIKDLPEYDG